jgi:hypothetical protein
VTAKERREVQRLNNRIEELERQHQKDMEVWRDTTTELIEMRTALRNIHDALVDAVIEANRVIRPAIDRMDKRLQVVADF